MNAYGTQAGRPLSKKRISLNFIPLFDPIIIFIHVIGFTLWITGFSPGIVFLCIYLVLVLYLVTRYIRSLQTRTFILKSTNIPGTLTIIPTIKFHKWDIVFETELTYQTGSINGKQITWVHYFVKHDPNCQIIKASLKDKNVQHFLANSKHTHAIHFPTPLGSEVRWIDLRFRNKNHYPYMAVVKLGYAKTILASYTGWIHDSKKLETKLLSPSKRAMPL